MDINKLLQRLKLASQNPDLGIAFSNEEILQVAMALLSSIETTNKAIEDGRLKGIDGISPKSGVDFMSKAEQEQLIKTTLSSFTGNLDKSITAKLESLTSGVDGEDAVISDELIGKVAGIAAGLIVVPDVSKAAETAITASPESIRDALELFIEEDDKLSLDSIGGLSTRIEELQNAVLTQTQRPAGGISKNAVLDLIEENAGGGTFLSLEDTPNSYSGEALKVSRVNAAEDAMEFVTLAGGGDALTTDPLSQFAATTSAQLAGVLSDETGTGLAVFNDSPTLVTPTADAYTLDTAAGHTVAQGEIAWNADEETVDIGLNGAVLQAGQETHYHVRNSTGSTILNGTAVMAAGTVGASGRILIAKMDGSDITNAKFFLGVTTEDIATATDGKVTSFGKVRGLDTSTFTEGDVLWVDNAVAGGLTATEPTSGTRLPVAFVITDHATNGVLAIRATDGTYLGEAHDTAIASEATGEVLQHNGTAWINAKVGFTNFDTDTSDTMAFSEGAGLDAADITVTSDGAIITLNLEKDGGGDLRFIFSDGVHTHDCTPTATVSLTVGSDTSPQVNYVYILQSTKVLTVSTSDFPSSGQYAPIAKVLCQSATTVQTHGPLIMHVHNDHMSGPNNNGHLSHLNHWIRHQSATWESGVALTPTITTNGGAEDNIDIATSSGNVLQLHDHTFPAFDTGVSDHVLIPNYNGAAYTKVSDLNAADQDDAGNAIANNKWTNLVVWGVANEDGTDSHLMVNLPSAFHSSASAATIDAEKYSNYTIPTEYKGVGFLITRLTLKYTTASSGTWALVENLDLRESGAVGGSGVGSTEFADNVFRVLDDADTSKEIAFQASGITTATTRTITMADANVDLGNLDTTNIASGAKTGADLDFVTGTAGTNGNIATWNADGDLVDGGVAPATLTGTVNFIIDGGGSAITTGIKGDVQIDFDCTIDSVTLLADQSGSIVVDIWNDTYANYPATNADSITASAAPTITTATKSTDATLTGWTTTITAGDILRFNVDSITTCERVTLALKITRT